MKPEAQFTCRERHNEVPVGSQDTSVSKSRKASKPRKFLLKNSITKLGIQWMLCCLGLLHATVSLAVVPGTVISNQAQVDYANSLVTSSASSNIVSITTEVGARTTSEASFMTIDPGGDTFVTVPVAEYRNRDGVFVDIPAPEIVPGNGILITDE